MLRKVLIILKSLRIDDNMSDTLEDLKTRMWEAIIGCKSDKKIYDLYVEAIKLDISQISPKTYIDKMVSSSNKFKLITGLVSGFEKEIFTDMESFPCVLNHKYLADIDHEKNVERFKKILEKTNMEMFNAKEDMSRSLIKKGIKLFSQSEGSI